MGYSLCPKESRQEPQTLITSMGSPASCSPSTGFPSCCFMTAASNRFPQMPKRCTLKTDSVSLNLNQIVSYFTMFVPVFGILYLLIILPEDTLSVGELVAVYSLMGTYYSSAISFFTLFLNTSTYKSSLEYLNDFLDEESQKKDKHINPKEFKLLTFEDVSFSYMQKISKQINSSAYSRR